MKKIYCVMITAVLLVSGAAVAWGTEANYYNEGNTGFTEAAAYIIDSVEDFHALASRVNAGTEPAGRYYKLTKSLSGNISDREIGTDAGKPFTGHFDGGGYTVSSSSSVFGHIDTDGVAVKNLNVAINIHLNGYGMHVVVGGMVVNLVSGTIENCKVEGNVSIVEQGTTAGGIAGIVAERGIIKDCKFTGNVTSGNRNGGPSYQDTYAGGIAARLQGGTIENCQALITDAIYAYVGNSGGSEVATSFAGGIVGEAADNSTIKDCKAVGTFRSKQWAGGIVGYMHGGTLTGNSVHSVSAVEGNFAAGGIAGYLGGSAEASGNAIVLDSQVSAASRAAGGIIGQLNQATVKNNRAYTAITGRAAYKGKIIGEIVDSPNTIEGNYYSVEGAEYVIGYDSTLRLGSNEGGTQRDPETIEQIEQGNNDSTETQQDNNNAPDGGNNTDGGKTSDGNEGEDTGETGDDNTDSGGDSGGGGSSGGCDTGLGLLGLVMAVILLRRR